jgi:predicted RNA methylase
LVVATDIGRIVADLSAFYDFTDRIVVGVGAGGGQLVEYARPARQVIGVDPDIAALERLRRRLLECGLVDKFRLLAKDLLEVRPGGDVVLFEFCLHEMVEPERVLAHARELAPDVLVIDHAPGSRWMWYAAEDAGVEACWKAVERGAIRREQTAEAFQHFSDYAPEGLVPEDADVAAVRISELDVVRGSGEPPSDLQVVGAGGVQHRRHLEIGVLARGQVVIVHAHARKVREASGLLELGRHERTCR